jgi:hypothetical protein
MRLFKPGAAYYYEFTTANPTTGAATDADSLPVATITKNGTDDGSSPTGWSSTLTVTKIDTGRYKITGTIPSGYAAGDQIQVSVAATCSTIAGKAVVDSFRIISASGYDAIIAGSADYFTAIVDLFGHAVISGTVADAVATPVSFITNLTSAVNDFYKNRILEFTSGPLAGQGREITSYNGSTKVIEVGEAFSQAPADEDTFRILGYIAP